MTKNPLYKLAFRLKESDCTVISDKKQCLKVAELSIMKNRKLLEDYIKENLKFQYSLRPVISNKGPEIVNLMIKSSTKSDVGPMAAVAGVLADLAVQDMVKSGCNVAVVENGGEVSAISNQPIDIAFVAGNEQLSKEMGFRLQEFPIGVATSSGRFSHAFSFGDAEAVTIFAINAGLADAAATAVANIIKGDNIREVIREGIKKALSIDGVFGVFILYHDVVGKGGRIPELIKLT